jgi:hypothetical protein
MDYLDMGYWDGAGHNEPEIIRHSQRANLPKEPLGVGLHYAHIREAIGLESKHRCRAKRSIRYSNATAFTASSRTLVRSRAPRKVEPQLPHRSLIIAHYRPPRRQMPPESRNPRGRRRLNEGQLDARLYSLYGAFLPRLLFTGARTLPAKTSSHSISFPIAKQGSCNIWYYGPFAFTCLINPACSASSLLRDRLCSFSVQFNIY